MIRTPANATSVRKRHAVEGRRARNLADVLQESWFVAVIG